MVEEIKNTPKEQKKTIKLLTTSVISHIDTIAKNSSNDMKKYLCGLVYKHYKKLGKEEITKK